MVIYVVRGTTGEYSDRCEWPVKAFISEDAAKLLVTNATIEASRIQASRPSDYQVPEGESNRYDPNMDMDYTGTTYYYETVELDGGEA